MGHFRLQKKLRPVLKWAGGKNGLLGQLLPLFPSSFTHYFEPFGGAGAVFLALEEETHAIIDDANAELVILY